ncbi:DNA-binding protein inhibitor ID-3 [Podarcis lilfordi]|uniref:DNA-binding protein inhibitor ID-3 n=1 Tax=Podarcis lilfordi TaxID=74358 RepID=A0AA35LCA1_9SAUR|nr:DNA-binding protein inhibitor ID-3 [Podarcis lilfordi]
MRNFLEELQRFWMTELEDLEKEMKKKKEINIVNLSEDIAGLSVKRTEMEKNCQQATIEFLKGIGTTVTRERTTERSPSASDFCCRTIKCDKSCQNKKQKNQSPAQEEPKNLLYDMNDCYSKLRELAPRISQGTKVSQVEILQHVIDNIFDLQIMLEEQAKKGQDPPTAKTSLLSLKAAERASELCSKEERNLCH